MAEITLQVVVLEENLAALEAGQRLGNDAVVQLHKRADGAYDLLAFPRKGEGDRPPVNRAEPDRG